MYFEAVKFKRDENSVWEEGYCVGSLDDSSKGCFLDSNYQPVPKREDGTFAFDSVTNHEYALVVRFPEPEKKAVKKDDFLSAATILDKQNTDLATGEMKAFDSNGDGIVSPEEKTKLNKIIDVMKNKENQKLMMKVVSVIGIAAKDYKVNGNVKTALLKAVSSLPNNESEE